MAEENQLKDIKFILPVVAALAVSGCDSRPLNTLSYAEQLEAAEVIEARCAEAGAPIGTEQFETCAAAEVNAENARRANMRRSANAIGQGLQNASDSYNASAAANRTVQCTTRPAIGWGSATTTCY
jgi:hypothetical protein